MTGDRASRDAREAYENAIKAGLPATPPPPAPSFEVWPMNWQAFTLAARCATQWRFAGMGTPAGMDYNVPLRIMELEGIKAKEQLQILDQLQAIESGMLDAFGEAAA